MHSPTNAWEQELISLHTRLAPLFHHPGPQQRSLAYLKGLLSDVERKNGWQLAEWIGERTTCWFGAAGMKNRSVLILWCMRAENRRI
ncbi:hypothetical protein [Xenorhabdus cabanillasii]|uniref:Uncharacterized protein n=1 Tax=Xenorhabdus cabanillasii JM26 TaxID=1427517 RepID=W1IR29_9GAMM|nr:hypothetical protein [Xenorhabdus cabanillasii]PHM77467.1 endonuclease [Xenorhabdus cabanillasii JM26]CDL79685.1 hypothetical protein XCR1_1200040 [Xenorhabdus cabanillasii JM26]